MLFFGCSTISEIKAFERIYGKYISEMKHGSGKGCPLCHREFDTAKEMHRLIDEVSAAECLLTYSDVSCDSC